MFQQVYVLATEFARLDVEGYPFFVCDGDVIYFTCPEVTLTDFITLA